MYNSTAPKEFEELRSVDHNFRRSVLFEEGEKLRDALEALGNVHHYIYV